MNINYDFDFGFSEDAEVEEKLQSAFDAETVMESLAVVTKRLYTLLDNLNKNPESEYIKWPNRAAKIEEFKAIIEEIPFVKEALEQTK